MHLDLRSNNEFLPKLQSALFIFWYLNVYKEYFCVESPNFNLRKMSYQIITPIQSNAWLNRVSVQ